MAIQSKPALTAEQWQEVAEQALARAAKQPRELRGLKGRASSKQLSIRRLVWSQAENILALNAKGISYREIAEQLTEGGISITDSSLRRYLYDYRKQRSQGSAAQVQPAQTESMSAKERLRATRF